MTTSRGPLFRGCRYSVMFRPPSLLAPRIVPTAANTAAGQLGLLRLGLSCFVASARSRYANRPRTGNWRYGDLHPARLSALSAAPCPCHRAVASTPPRSDVASVRFRHPHAAFAQWVGARPSDLVVSRPHIAFTVVTAR